MSIETIAVACEGAGFIEKLSKKLEVMVSQYKISVIVHSLTFPKTFSEENIAHFNRSLSSLYARLGLSVAGGDTSRGSQLVVVISGIVEWSIISPPPAIQ